MNIVYPICCGIDVHKTFLVATIITSQGFNTHYSKKRFSTFNNSIIQFKQWLIDNNCLDVCMESTGKYWVPVCNVAHGHQPNIVNIIDLSNIIINVPKISNSSIAR